MTLNLRTRMERRLKKLGIAKSTATLYSGFFFSLMMSVCGLMGVAPCPEGQSETGDEIPGFLRPELAFPSAQVIMSNGFGKLSADPRAVSVLSANFGLRRH
jgi:hypothetical protein